jgi:hypothetical protein
MPIRSTAIHIVGNRQATLNASMFDKNGKQLFVGDVVEYKKDAIGEPFLKMGVVCGKDQKNGNFLLIITDGTGLVGKFKHNVRKVSRGKAVLFKLENA